MEATYISINRWMNKEVVVHIYNGILLSHKKEPNWVICRDMDGSKVCHTEWNKSEREKQIKSIKAYMWNLENVPEKAMAPHSSALAWKIPWTEEPGRLQYMGARRVRHDWATSLWLFTFMHWRRKWQPIPVFLPTESQGRGSLVGCPLWGCTESDMTEVT